MTTRRARRAWAAAQRKHLKRGRVLTAEVQHKGDCAIFTSAMTCTCEPLRVLKDETGRVLARVEGAGFYDPLEPFEILGDRAESCAPETPLARKIAAFMAEDALQLDRTLPAGRHTTGTAAQGLLAEGFEELLRNGGRPVVRQITVEQAALLPSCYGPTPPEAQWWIGFGVDVDECGTWITRWFYRPGLAPDVARDLNEVEMLRHLGAVCNVSGLPEELLP